MSRARDLADLGGSANAGTVTGDSLIINGDFAVAQRGTSSTANGYGSVDRFSQGRGGGTRTFSQESLSSGDPYNEGFRKHFRITNTTAGSNNATDYVEAIYYIEAQDVASSGWDYTSSDSYVTLSFWVRSSVAGTYSIRLRDEDATTYSYGFTYTLAANTWTKVTHSIAGNSNLVFNNDNGRGLRLDWQAFYGSDYTVASPTLNAWTTSTPIPDYATTWNTTTGATFDFTGVKVEVGSTATPFKHESYGDNLRKCQRYFCKSYDDKTAVGTGTAVGAIYDRFPSAVSNRGVSVQFPVTMRDNPTITLYSLNGTSGNVSDTNTGYSHSSDDTSSTSGTVGRTGFSKVNGIANADFIAFHFTAEIEL